MCESWCLTLSLGEWEMTLEQWIPLNWRLRQIHRRRQYCSIRCCSSLSPGYSEKQSPGTSDSPGVRVIPAGLDSRAGVSCPGAHTVGAPAHTPTPGDPGLVTLTTAPPSGQERRLCGLNQPPGGIGATSSTGARWSAPTGGRARANAGRTIRRDGPGGARDSGRDGLLTT